MFTAFQKVMDEFQQFDNTAGFFVGNEVITTSMLMVSRITSIARLTSE